MSDYAPHACKSLKIEEAKVEYLPPEILMEIVVRLPIKSILTWTSVSKSWNSLIKSPNFVSTHLNHTIHSYNHNATHLLLLRKLVEPIEPIWFREAKYVKEVYSLHWDNEAFDEYTRFDFPFPGLGRYKFCSILGTCNGLVCLADEFNESCNFFVWNPCVRKYLSLPTPNITSESIGGGSFDVCNGFGFDSKTNDYKVVRVVTLVEEEDSGESPPKVDVYSLATGKWKMVTAVPPVCVVCPYGTPAFVNGALHWAVLRMTNDRFYYFVLVFDLGDEDFRKIMLPKDLLIKDDSFDLSVSICGESIAAFCRMNSVSCIHVWVMKEYGVLESWTKVLTVGPQGPGVEIPLVFDFLTDEDGELDGLGFRKSGEVVIETVGGKLVSIDYKRKKIKEMRTPRHGYTSVDPYVESLVLLDKSEDAVSY